MGHLPPPGRRLRDPSAARKGQPRRPELHLLRIAGTDEHRPQAGEGHDDEGAGHEGSRLTASTTLLTDSCILATLSLSKVARASVTRQ